MDYISWERVGSHPKGREKIKAAFDDYPDCAGVGSELFTDSARIQSHADQRNKDVKRVEYTGQVILSSINPCVRPGVTVSIEGRNTIRTFSVVKSVTYSADEQNTKMELASADMKELYDIPTPMRAKGASSGGYSQQSNDSGYKNSDSYTTGSNSGNGDYDSSSNGKTRVRQENHTGGRDMSFMQGDVPAEKRQSKIYSGDELKLRDEADAALGRNEKGIYTGKQAKDKSEELIGKFYGQGEGRKDELDANVKAGRGADVRGDDSPSRKMDNPAPVPPKSDAKDNAATRKLSKLLGGDIQKQKRGKSEPDDE
jgi:hypothetical protein